MEEVVRDRVVPLIREVNVFVMFDSVARLLQNEGWQISIEIIVVSLRRLQRCLCFVANHTRPTLCPAVHFMAVWFSWAEDPACTVKFKRATGIDLVDRLSFSGREAQ